MSFPDYGTSITLAAAKSVAAAAQASAENNGWQVVIVIVDTGGNPVLLHRMDNAHLGSVAIAEQKAKTAVGFRRDTKIFEGAVALGGEHLKILGAGNILPMEGGVLLLKEGKIIGAVGVSGAQPSEDGQVAASGAAAV